MQPLKLFTFVCLVAGCAYYAKGYPAEIEQSKPTDFYECVRNVCNAVWSQYNDENSAANKLLGDSASAFKTGLYNTGGLVKRAGYAGIQAGIDYVRSEDGTARITGAAKTFGTGMYHGAALAAGTGKAGIMAGANYIRSDEGINLLYTGASDMGNGLLTGVNYVMHGDSKTDGDGAKTEAEENAILTQAAKTVGGGMCTIGEALMKAGKIGLMAAADYLRSDEGSYLLVTSAKEIGTGVYNGGGAVLSASIAGLKAGANYVRSEEGRKSLYAAASAVKDGMYSATMYVRSGALTPILSSLGACAQFTLASLAHALSTVNWEGLASSLGLSNVYVAFSNKVDVYSVLTQLMMNQSTDPNGGGTQYAVATLFLQKLVGLVPPLKKLLDALQTVSYVMSKIKQLQSENKPIEPTTLMKEALGMYFMDVDPAFKEKLIDLSPVVYKAAMGEPEAAREIVTALATRDTIVQTLKGMGYKRQIEIMQMVLGQVWGSASTVQALNEAQTK